MPEAASGIEPTTTYDEFSEGLPIYDFPNYSWGQPADENLFVQTPDVDVCPSQDIDQNHYKVVTVGVLFDGGFDGQGCQNELVSAPPSLDPYEYLIVIKPDDLNPAFPDPLTWDSAMKLWKRTYEDIQVVPPPPRILVSNPTPEDDIS